ncbi:MAG: glycosyltransferase family 4 protein [Candidatus Gastranaerophilales bacterium]
MKKKIAFFCDKYQELNISTGGEKLNFILICQLVEKGFIVDVFAKNYPDLKSVANDYYNICDIDVNSVTNNYDIVLSEGANYPSDITYIHGHSYNYRISKTQNKFQHFIYKIISNKSHKKRLKADELIKKNIENINKIIVSSNVLKQDYIENFGISEDKLVTIPPPIISSIVDYKLKNKKKTVFGISANGFVNKGGFILIKAIKELTNTHNDFGVRVIYQKAKKNLALQFLLNFYGIRKYIDFIPTQKNMSTFYNSLDFCLQTSFFETFAMVASEAMNHYKPVIVTDVCGVCDILINGKNSFICSTKTNRVKNLVECMKKAIDLSEVEYEKMAKNAFESTLELSVENFIHKYIEEIRNV